MKVVILEERGTAEEYFDGVMNNVVSSFPDSVQVVHWIIKYQNYSAKPDQMIRTVERLNEMTVEYQPDYIIMMNVKNGCEYAGRLAGRTGYLCYANVEKICYERRKGLSVKIPVYNGNVTATISCQGKRTILVLNPAAFSDKKSGGWKQGAALKNTVEIQVPADSDFKTFYMEQTAGHNEEQLKDADWVIVLGHGFRNKEEVMEAEKITKQMRMKLGASRPVVIDGLVEESRLVGMSGNILKAKGCIVLGASGASAFLEGIKYCKNVIAVNHDEQAAIFKGSNYGMVADCHRVISEVENIMEEQYGFEQVSER